MSADAAELPIETRLIPAPTEREALDWSLVLASQEIPTRIERQESGCVLVVPATEWPRATDSIRQYQRENRHWHWTRPVIAGRFTFDGTALIWCGFLALIHFLVTFHAPAFSLAARMDSALAGQGQWWRLFSAMLLHANAPHLFSNISLGLLLWGLAMGALRPGIALCASYLAGAAGNLFALLLATQAYKGVGASGMVMGALGLLAVQPVGSWRQQSLPAAYAVRAFLAGLLLFVLVGVDPNSDILAHLGGFLAGIILGIGLHSFPKVQEARATDLLAWTTLAALLFTTTLAALSAIPSR